VSSSDFFSAVGGSFFSNWTGGNGVDLSYGKVSKTPRFPEFPFSFFLGVIPISPCPQHRVRVIVGGRL
ncbi:hypothetical protein ACVGXS_01015, partial [Enterobacter hormaechei]